MALKEAPERCSEYQLLCLEKEAEVLCGLTSLDSVVRLVAVVVRPDSANILRVHGLVLDYIDGPLLFSRIRESRKQCNVDRRLGYLRQIASSLQQLHQRNVVHRDLKPSNLVVREADDKVIVIDFGVARPQESDGKVDTDHNSAGTLNYLAPEQLNNQAFDCKVDVFAFGVMIPEVMMGHSYVLSVDDRKNPNADLLAGFPAVLTELRDLCNACLAFDPARRPHFSQIIPVIDSLF